MKHMLLAAAAFAVATSAYGQDSAEITPIAHAEATDDRKVFFFGGRMGESTMGPMLFPFTAEYENAIILGGGYQQFFAEPAKDLKVGVEAGGAIRVGEETTGEAWAGVVARYDGFVIGGKIRVSPSLTFGGSVVTDTMGAEAERAAADGLPGNTLFYLSPEISIGSTENPDSEVFWRLHHRSGAWNSFGGGGTANATTVGVRQSF